jgi:ATP-dependent Clp protease ATP-binding subunit ClpC
MTSNIGQDEFTKKAQSIGFWIEENEEEKILDDYSKAATNIKENLTDYFSPEFINRIDKILVFNPLDTAGIKKIVKIALEDTLSRLESKWYTLSYDAKVINFITKQVYNPEYGAREVRRYIIDEIEDSLAEKIIAGKKDSVFTLKIVKNNLEIV